MQSTEALSWYRMIQMYCRVTEAFKQGCYSYLSPQNSLPAAFAAFDREHFAILSFVTLECKDQTYSISDKVKFTRHLCIHHSAHRLLIYFKMVLPRKAGITRETKYS